MESNDNDDQNGDDDDGNDDCCDDDNDDYDECRDQLPSILHTRSFAHEETSFQRGCRIELRTADPSMHRSIGDDDHDDGDDNDDNDDGKNIDNDNGDDENIKMED